jgi:hypothetical protein
MRFPSRPDHWRLGLTIIEVVVAMMVVSSMLIASLYAVAASRTTLMRARDRALGAELADDLLGFVYRLPYKSPSGSILGIELGNLLADKTTLDDVDDFDGYQEKPPVYANGTVMPGLAEWTRKVRVQFVDIADPTVVVGGDSGVKRITVTVERWSVEVARRVALRTDLSSASE